MSTKLKVVGLHLLLFVAYTSFIEYLTWNSVEGFAQAIYILFMGALHVLTCSTLLIITLVHGKDVVPNALALAMIVFLSLVRLYPVI